MRYPIQKNSIQETLVIPLYGRALCSRKFPQLFADQTASELLERIDYDFSALERKSDSLMQIFGALEVAMRQGDLAFEVRDYLSTHPKAAVVNLGCGLDQTGRACDNGQCYIYNIDLPDVMAVREALLPAGERERNLRCSLPPACFTTFGRSRCAPSARPWRNGFRTGGWYLTPPARRR